MHSQLPWTAEYVIDGYHKVLGQSFLSGEAQTVKTEGIAFCIQHHENAVFIAEACTNYERTQDQLAKAISLALQWQQRAEMMQAALEAFVNAHAMIDNADDADTWDLGHIKVDVAKTKANEILNGK